MDKNEERAFVHKLVKMDERTWEVFCKDYSRPLLAFVQFRFGCNREKAEEIVQMAFIRCVKSIKNFNPSRGSLLEWLKAIVKNEAYTLRQKERKQLPTTDEIVEKVDTVALSNEVISKEEVQILIHETIIELYSRYRKVLILKYIENRKVAEIAKMLGHSEKTIESLLSRSRQAFRNAFMQKAKGLEIKESGLLK